MHLSQRFSNLRRIKLFFNRLNASMGPITEEVSLLDFMLLEILRDYAPDIYETIYVQRRYFFEGKWSIETWLEALHPDDSTADKLRKQFFDELLNPLESAQRELITKLLCELFPVVRRYRGDPLGESSASIESKRERRIYHPAFFARYFIFGVQTGQFGEATFNRFASDLEKSGDIEHCKRLVRAELAELSQDSRKRLNFLDLIATKIERLTIRSAEAVSLTLSELSELLEPPIFGLAEADTAGRIGFLVAQMLAGSQKVQSYLEEAIRVSSADYFATLLLVACEKPDKNQILTNWENVKIEGIRLAFRARMNQKYFPGTRASIFDAANQKGAVQSLRYWVDTGGKKEVRSYLRHEFESRPQSLGTVMSFMFPTEANATAETLKPLSEFLPLGELEQLLDNHGPSAFPSSEEETAINRFRRLLANARLPSL